MAANNKKPILIAPQKQKSLSEKREEYRKQKEKEKAERSGVVLGSTNFYSNKKSDSGSSALSGDKTTEKSKPDQGGWMSKVTGKTTSKPAGTEKRRRRSSKADEATSLSKALIDAKCRMNDRKFQSAMNPTPVVRRTSSGNTKKTKAIQ